MLTRSVKGLPSMSPSRKRGWGLEKRFRNLGFPGLSARTRRSWESREGARAAA